MKPIKEGISLKELEYFAKKYISMATIQATFYNIFDEKKYEVWAKPDIETACTFFDHESQKHIIFIGAVLDNYMNVGFDADKQNLVTALLIHETGHTEYTTKNMKRLNEKLKEENLPFSLWNLAEDARIEHKIKEFIRFETGKNYTFGWDRWLKSAEESADMSPESILFNIINTERRKPIRAIRAYEVEEYYDRFIAAKDSFEVVDILVDWRNRFYPMMPKSPGMASSSSSAPTSGSGRRSPGTGQGDGGGNGNNPGAGDALARSMEALENALSSNPRAAQREGAEEGDKASAQQNASSGGLSFGDNEENESGAPGNGKDSLPPENDPNIKHLADVKGPVDENGNPVSLEDMKANALQLTGNTSGLRESSAPFRVNARFNTVPITECSNTKEIFNRTDERDFQKETLTKIIAYLKKIEDTQKNKKINTRKHTKTYNTKGIAGLITDPGNTKAWKKKKDIPVKLEDKNITLILDLSSSMGGLPVASQRTLLVAFNRIAMKFKKLKINAIGSKVDGHKSIYETISLPANEQNLVSIIADGGSEGIGYAIEKNSKLLKRQDFVIFITDGRIHDREISKKYIGKHLNSGAKTIGIYVEKGGLSIHNEKMKDWFDELIVDDELLSVVERLVTEMNSLDQKGRKKRHISSILEETGASPTVSPKR